MLAHAEAKDQQEKGNKTVMVRKQHYVLWFGNFGEASWLRQRLQRMASKQLAGGFLRSVCEEHARCLDAYVPGTK